MRTNANKGTERVSTIRDIAREVGVCVATVSNALNGRGSKVSPTLAEKIRLKADEMGYVKNMTAASLSGRTTQMIDLVIAGIFYPSSSDETFDVNPFYGELIFRLEHEARKRGFSLAIYTGLEDECVREQAARKSDATVAVGLSSPEIIARVLKRNPRLILFDSYIEKTDAMIVRTDEARGAEMAAQHLITKGRKKLAYVGHGLKDFPKNIPAIRYRGAKRAADAAGISLQVVEEWTSLAGGKRAAVELAKMKLDGIVTSADVLAAGIVEGLKQQQVHIPEDIAVMGYDNLSVARMVTPALSTIDQELDKKVIAALDLVADGKPGDIRSIDPRLVLRESA